MPEPEDPGLAADTGFSKAELAEIAKATKRKYEAKSRLAYSEALGLEICARMVTRGPTGRVQSLTEVCAAPDMPHEETVRRWRKLHPAFAAAYSEAREERAGMLGDEIIAIADDSELDPQRVRNMVSARQWYAARINRREFGEASVHAVSLTPMDAEGGSSDRDLARRVALILQEMLSRRQAKQLTVEARPVEDDDAT